jgi:hypothetical protein
MVLEMLLFSLALVGVVFVFAYLWDLAFTTKGDFPITQFLFMLALFLMSLREVLSYVISALNAPAFQILYDVLDMVAMLSVIIAFGMYLWKGKKPGEDEEEMG